MFPNSKYINYLVFKKKFSKNFKKSIDKYTQNVYNISVIKRKEVLNNEKN